MGVSKSIFDLMKDLPEKIYKSACMCNSAIGVAIHKRVWLAVRPSLTAMGR